MTNWNKNQPIVLHLRQVLPDVFPVLRTPGHGIHASGIGGYNNRTTRSGSFSFHSEGRAADIYLNAHKPHEKSIGDGLFYMFINHASDLGVHHVIWNRKIWSIDKSGIRRYSGGSHTDHVHVAFTREGSQKRPVKLRQYASNVSMSILQVLRSKIATGE